MLIKTCPHCGGEASLKASYSPSRERYYVYVKCHICGAQGKSYYTPVDPEEDNFTSWPCGDAVSAWNMRYGRNYDAEGEDT